MAWETINLEDIPRAGHREPDWETNELETSGEPDTWKEPDTSQERVVKPNSKPFGGKMRGN